MDEKGFNSFENPHTNDNLVFFYTRSGKDITVGQLESFSSNKAGAQAIHHKKSGEIGERLEAACANSVISDKHLAFETVGMWSKSVLIF